MKVCILAAGKGTRMGPLTLHTNKALLPFKKKAILSHIIESFPSTYHFVIALGYKGPHIRQYLQLAHEKINFTFINVKNFDGDGSGPGRSLLECQNALQEPFYLVCADTLWNPKKESLAPSCEDWVGCSSIKKNSPENFCTLKVENDGVVSKIYDKEINSPSKWAFNGIFYIYNYTKFFDGLTIKKSIKNEHQLSNGFSSLINEKKLKARPMPSWIDLGNSKNYISLNKSCPQFIFRKNNEYFYDLGDKIIKFFANKKVVKDRVQRQKLLNELTPSVSKHNEHFLTYDKVPGEVFYKKASPESFHNLLEWLKEKLWIKKNVKTETFQLACYRFYKEKTFLRLRLYKNRFPQDSALLLIETLLKNVDWQFLSQGKAHQIHGDLQFDNILTTSKGYLLIDWRQSFADHLDHGDIYYDLAKLQMGIDIDLSQVKNLFNLETPATYPLPEIKNAFLYSKNLRTFCSQNNLSYEKVELISILNLLNMAPLHSDELAKIFWHAGLNRLLKYQAKHGQKILCSQGPIPKID